MICFDFIYILDIFSLTNGTTASRDPFTSINTLYLKNINGKPYSFLNDTEPVENPNSFDEKVDHHLTVTLLPHQILIFPVTLYDNMDPYVINDMAMYSNDEVR